MKTFLSVMLMLGTSIPALAQPASQPGHSPDQAIYLKSEDMKWEKIIPELGDKSPEIIILHVDPNTKATKLMIRTPKDFYVPKHWHTANETHTVISGTFIMQHEPGQRHELGPGSFNYVPRRWSMRPGPSPRKALCCSSPSMVPGTSTG
jgi:quercetin dioxygenase-like cupin family protein